MPAGSPDKSKLKPLTAHAWGWLAALERHDYQRHEINPGVIDRFHREGLVEVVVTTQMVKITDAGRKKLAERNA